MTTIEKQEYDAIREQIKKLQERAEALNPFLKLKNMSNKEFGEQWSESYIRSKVSSLRKNNGAGHDMGGNHYNNIEVKSSRIVFEGNWTENQLHPSQADCYLFVWYDCENGTEKICLIPTKDLVEKCSLIRQHGDGCFSMGSTVKNRQILKQYMIPSWEELNRRV